MIKIYFCALYFTVKHYRDCSIELPCTSLTGIRLPIEYVFVNSVGVLSDLSFTYDFSYILYEAVENTTVP